MDGLESPKEKERPIQFSVEQKNKMINDSLRHGSLTEEEVQRNNLRESSPNKVWGLLFMHSLTKQQIKEQKNSRILMDQDLQKWNFSTLTIEKQLLMIEANGRFRAALMMPTIGRQMKLHNVISLSTGNVPKIADVLGTTRVKELMALNPEEALAALEKEPVYIAEAEFAKKVATSIKKSFTEKRGDLRKDVEKGSR